MEHRWGDRMAVDIPVRLQCAGVQPANGRISNLSISGALIATAAKIPRDAWLEVQVQDKWVPACVVRSDGDSFGVEWCELSPEQVSVMTQEAMACRRM